LQQCCETVSYYLIAVKIPFGKSMNGLKNSFNLGNDLPCIVGVYYVRADIEFFTSFTQCSESYVVFSPVFCIPLFCFSREVGQVV
jgi:hypothetical protein